MWSAPTRTPPCPLAEPLSENLRRRPPTIRVGPHPLFRASGSARRDPATSSANQGCRKRRFGLTLMAGGPGGTAFGESAKAVVSGPGLVLRVVTHLPEIRLWKRLKLGTFRKAPILKYPLLENACLSAGGTTFRESARNRFWAQLTDPGAFVPGLDSKQTQTVPGNGAFSQLLPHGNRFWGICAKR